MRKQTIVAEISKNYPLGADASGPLLAVQFEAAIEANRGRGYVLSDWHLSTVLSGGAINETIIAVFELTGGARSEDIREAAGQ